MSRIRRWVTNVLHALTFPVVPPPNTAIRRVPVPNYVTPQSGNTQTTPLKDRVTGVENLTRQVLFVTLATLVGVIVSLSSIMLDQWRFNQQSYRESATEANSKVDELNLRIEVLRKEIEILEAKSNASNTNDETPENKLP